VLFNFFLNQKFTDFDTKVKYTWTIKNHDKR